MLDTFQQFIGERDVNVYQNSGFASLSVIVEHMRRIKRKQKQGRHCTILYAGDLDPSGDDMDRYLQETIDFLRRNEPEFYDLDDIEFKRIAVTVDQVREYNLPKIPEDSETRDKARRDSRTPGFIAKYGELMLVELDAMFAVAPAQFRRFVQQQIDALFDVRIERELRRTHSEEAVNKAMRKFVTLVRASREARTMSQRLRNLQDSDRRH